VATTQANRTLQLSSPLGADTLLVTRFAAREHISRLFEYELELLSETADIDADKILGQPVTLTLGLPDDAGQRFFNGFVTEFSQVGYGERFHQYQAVVHPWFWFLTRTADCRIFQGKAIPEIFQAVAKQCGFTDFKLRLSGSYAPRNYCVQYRETDFNFLSRLLEQEGIHYFFQHEDGKHTMILADDANAHDKVAGYETVPFFPPAATTAQRERDHLESWGFTKSVQPAAYALTDYDFTAPRKSLLQSATISRAHAHAGFEIFDYPAELGKLDSAESSKVAKIRVQELQATQTLAHGHGNAAGLATGYCFTLSQYPRDDFNIEYLIISSNITVSSDAHQSGGGQSPVELSIGLEAIDAKTPYRPQRITPKPVVQGAQTAVVVGKSGEEIYTDEYGCVKVQFPWDRHGKNDENSGCWIRVAQVWAGKQWGAMHIPRIGQEVIVNFLEGDPDQPIITGRVYNGANMPPYDLPANKTESGIKSRSSKDGAAGNFNELRFEDKKGSELLTIHAERNHSLSVEVNESHAVGNDEFHTVGRDENEHVKRNRTRTVDSDESITIGANRTESVAINQSTTVGASRADSIGANDSLTIGASHVVTVGADQVVSVGGSRSLDVGKDESITVAGNRQDSVAKDVEIDFGQNRKAAIAENDSLSVGKQLVIDAADEIVLKSGDASVTLKKDGTITLKGKNVTIDGSGDIKLSASGNVVVKGSKIAQN
jgi:type VI secretion system secreted protein VgrG